MSVLHSPENLTHNDRRYYGHFIIEITKWFDQKAESDLTLKDRLESIKKEYSDMSESLRSGDPSTFTSFTPKYFD